MIASETDKKINFVILKTEKAAIASVVPTLAIRLLTDVLKIIEDIFLNADGAPSFTVSIRYLSSTILYAVMVMWI